MSFGTAMVIGGLLLIGNAFFVGAEFALISTRRTQIEPRVASGSRSARTTLRAMENVSLMMAGAQLGITLCSIGLGAVAKPAVAAVFENAFSTLGIPTAFVDPAAIAASLIIVVSLHMVLGEMVPKNIAIARPERSAMFLGPILFAVVTVLRPILWVLNSTANLVLRMLRVNVRDEVASAFTRDEVAGMIKESAKHGFLDLSEHDLLTGALDFSEVSAGDIAVPIDRLVTVTSDVTPFDLQATCVRTGYSRFPVVSEAGLLEGYVHVKDLVTIGLPKLEMPIEHRWIRDMPQVSVGDSLGDLLATMQRRGVHMVQVRDHGDLRGVAMMEDALEKLVGEVVA
jgi:CBS domain containing-hemolysin-like protein